ncbi:hypothetical protein KUV26_21300 [Leisingera daeponensis]|uniref:Uncharacterized protein n=1 Tax=Leisingera daeponensis TaxID=405746 RepID=A0ABS7NLB6_9RHOB|nr:MULTISPECIES: hypothetical protein [Leisingera]MBY6059134.1 hypothetical protein [Leisingera daeponensis]MBY6141978.1 hypothetical protein [Leisingera daeponensis]NSY40978.1 hypothetical protein [Leisingera sp. ANG59]
MTGQSRKTGDILMDRVKTIQAIAQANTEQLRLNQKASGLMVLEMKDMQDGVEDHAHEDAQAQNDAALKENTEMINRLEARLSALDEELEAAMKEQS